MKNVETWGLMGISFQILFLNSNIKIMHNFEKSLDYL